MSDSPNNPPSAPASGLGPVVLFPGQGAQVVGMGKDIYDQFPEAREVFDEADRILGVALSSICFDGPKERLDETDISQPAIFVTSVAYWRALTATARYRDLHPAAAAGLSLGEYTALWLAGTFDFETALRVVRERGLAMQAAADAVPSGMVAVMGLDDQQLKHVCEQACHGEVLAPANYNSPGQVVISGVKAACERAIGLVEQLGGKATVLAVAGAFHSELMEPAVHRLRAALEGAAMKPPAFPVISNVTARPHPGDVDAIRDSLCVQCAEPIQWAKSMQYLIAQKHTEFYEVGPGKLLTGLMRRIDKGVKPTNISSVESLA